MPAGQGAFEGRRASPVGGCAPHTPIPDERALRAALAHPPALGFSFCGGAAPTPPLGPAAATQPEAKRVSSVGAQPPRPRSDRQPRHSPRPNASPLSGRSPHAPARTGSRDTAQGQARLPCGGFAPTPPLGPAAATQPEDTRVSPVGASPPRPRSDRQPRHSPRTSASPLCGLRPHAPVRTGSRDTARGHARLPCGGFAPTPPLGPAAATQPAGTRVSSVGASPPRPRSDRQPGHSPRTSASPLCGLRPHAPAGSAARPPAPRAFRPPRPLRERAGVRGSDARRATRLRGRTGSVAGGVGGAPHISKQRVGVRGSDARRTTSLRG